MFNVNENNEIVIESLDSKVTEIVENVLTLDENQIKEFELHLRFKNKKIKDLKKISSKEQKEIKKIEDDISGRKKVGEIGINGEIAVSYKDGTVTGRITKIGEKTFTIEFDNEGEIKSLFRYYYQVI